MTIDTTRREAPTLTFPREDYIALLRRRSQDFESTEARAELLAGLGISPDLPALSQGDLETRIAALVDYLADPVHLDVAMRLARRVASRAGSEKDAESLFKTSTSNIAPVRSRLARRRTLVRFASGWDSSVCISTRSATDFSAVKPRCGSWTRGSPKPTRRWACAASARWAAVARARWPGTG